MTSTLWTGGQDSAPKYRIRVAGALGEEWRRRVDQIALSVHRGEPVGTVTELVVQMADEAGLMGLLYTLYNRGARLLSVEYLDQDRTGDAEREYDRESAK